MVQDKLISIIVQDREYTKDQITSKLHVACLYTIDIDTVAKIVANAYTVVATKRKYQGIRRQWVGRR